ncbi:MAG: hypothetical protein WBB08_05985 [Halobacteriota archaeon]
MGAATIEIGEEIVDEMRKRGIATTKDEAITIALLNFALNTDLLSRDVILRKIREKAREIKIEEAELEGLIQNAKEASIHR